MVSEAVSCLNPHPVLFACTTFPSKLDAEGIRICPFTTTGVIDRAFTVSPSCVVSEESLLTSLTTNRLPAGTPDTVSRFAHGTE
jgi:hypothetical protein